MTFIYTPDCTVYLVIEPFPHAVWWKTSYSVDCLVINKGRLELTKRWTCYQSVRIHCWRSGCVSCSTTDFPLDTCKRWHNEAKAKSEKLTWLTLHFAAKMGGKVWSCVQTTRGKRAHNHRLHVQVQVHVALHVNVRSSRILYTRCGRPACGRPACHFNDVIWRNRFK